MIRTKRLVKFINQLGIHMVHIIWRSYFLQKYINSESHHWPTNSGVQISSYSTWWLDGARRLFTDDQSSSKLISMLETDVGDKSVAYSFLTLKSDATILVTNIRKMQSTMSIRHRYNKLNIIFLLGPSSCL